MIINYVIYNITRWTIFHQLTHTADGAKAKHVSQVQEDKWNNITKSCVYLQLNTKITTGILKVSTIWYQFWCNEWIVTRITNKTLNNGRN